MKKIASISSAALLLAWMSLATAGIIPPGNSSSGVSSFEGRTGVVTTQSGDYSATQITGAEQTANKNASGGYAGIDANGKLHALDGSQLTGLLCSGGVNFFNGRTGDVVPQTGDYNATQVGLKNVNNPPQPLTTTGGIIYSQAGASNGTGADTTDDTLLTYNLPANTLVSNGTCVKIHAYGTTANNSDSKTIKVYIGGVVFPSITASSAAFSWEANATICRSGASSEDGTICFSFGTNTLQESYVGFSFDTTQPVLIKVVGKNGAANANDIVGRGLVVGYGL